MDWLSWRFVTTARKNSKAKSRKQSDEEKPESNENSTLPPKSNPFVFLRAINDTKEDIWDEDSEKLYNPWLINRGMSLFSDSILHSNAMNERWILPKKLQFDFYMYGVKQARRFGGKWPKTVASEVVGMISDVYNLNKHRARELAAVLTAEQIEIIRKRHDTGGES